jgi:hypothetical protein
LNDGTLGNFNWQTSSGNDPDPDDYADSAAHSYIIYNKSTNSASDSDCSRNDNLYDDGNGNDDNDGNGNGNDSGACTLIVGLVLFVVVLLF